MGEPNSKKTVLLTREKAAERMAKNVSTLTRWEKAGRGPRVVRLVGRVYYREVDIEAFIESCVVDPADAVVERRRNRRRSARSAGGR
jgi:predicted site-specific integrase-resolvase